MSDYNAVPIKTAPKPGIGLKKFLGKDKIVINPKVPDERGMTSEAAAKPYSVSRHAKQVADRLETSTINHHKEIYRAFHHGRERSGLPLFTAEKQLLPGFRSLLNAGGDKDKIKVALKLAHKHGRNQFSGELSANSPEERLKQIQTQLKEVGAGNKKLLGQLKKIKSDLGEETIAATCLRDVKEQNWLEKKALETGYPIETLEEVYERGIVAWFEQANPTQTAQQAAFNRVSSFVGGGNAAEIDADLTESDPARRGGRRGLGDPARYTEPKTRHGYKVGDPVTYTSSLTKIKSHAHVIELTSKADHVRIRPKGESVSFSTHVNNLQRGHSTLVREMVTTVSPQGGTKTYDDTDPRKTLHAALKVMKRLGVARNDRKRQVKSYKDVFRHIKEDKQAPAGVKVFGVIASMDAAKLKPEHLKAGVTKVRTRKGGVSGIVTKVFRHPEHGYAVHIKTTNNKNFRTALDNVVKEEVLDEGEAPGADLERKRILRLYAKLKGRKTVSEGISTAMSDLHRNQLSHYRRELGKVHAHMDLHGMTDELKGQALLHHQAIKSVYRAAARETAKRVLDRVQHRAKSIGESKNYFTVRDGNGVVNYMGGDWKQASRIRSAHKKAHIHRHRKVDESQENGSPYDRGDADAFYGRKKKPHYYKGSVLTGPRVNHNDMQPHEVAAYHAGYRENPSGKKDYD